MKKSGRLFLFFILTLSVFAGCTATVSEAQNGADGKDGTNGINGTDGKNGVDGKDGKDGASINWRGSYENAEEISSPCYLDAFYNITDGCCYIYDGTSWTLLSKAGHNGTDGADGKDGIDGKDGTNGIDGKDGADGKDGVSLVWRGSYESEEEISNPSYMDVYYNTTTGCSYIYDGEKWTLLAKSGSSVNTGTALSGTNENSDTAALDLSVPNDTEENTILTIDSAPIAVSIPEKYQVTKVVWKKSSNDIIPNPIAILSDEKSQPVILNFSNKGTFYVPENGWYDVVAQDSLGHCEWNRIEVKTIDKIPLEEVKKLAVSTKDRAVTVTWKDVSATEKYDSPLKSIKLSFIYNDEETDTANTELIVDAGTETASLTFSRARTSEDFIRVKVQTVDELGNISEGTSAITWCSNSIYATTQTLYDRLMEMTASGEIAIVGECTSNRIKDCLEALYEKKPDISVELDLTELTDWDTVANRAFREVRNLSKVILPSGITKIESEAFFGCYRLTSVIIPEGVTEIEFFAFYNCKLLTGIDLPDSLIELGESAFGSCSSLTSITLPKNLKYIGNQAFDSTDISEIIIPASVNRFVDGSCWYSGNAVFEDTITIWYEAEYDDFRGGTKLGPMTQETLENLPSGYYYSEKYLEEIGE